jgi:hypothetical protein
MSPVANLRGTPKILKNAAQTLSRAPLTTVAQKTVWLHRSLSRVAAFSYPVCCAPCDVLSLHTAEG